AVRRDLLPPKSLRAKDKEEMAESHREQPSSMDEPLKASRTNGPRSAPPAPLWTVPRSASYRLRRSAPRPARRPPAAACGQDSTLYRRTWSGPRGTRVTVCAKWPVIFRFVARQATEVDEVDDREGGPPMPLKHPPHPGGVVVPQGSEPSGLTIAKAAAA